ncbi:GMC family oxidoreductase [Dokdonia sp.]|uniref:GMC family oxidoreductase n=1 Tax=Dokdonia sp. TaxID=2024995 RepID=UPI003266D1E0
MKDKEYDVVIVGSGISGSIMAKTLTQAGKSVLLLEAGLTAGATMKSNGSYYNYMTYMETFFNAAAKVPNSPYPNLKDAPSIDVINIETIPSPTEPSTKGDYLVQAGPLPFGSDNWRGPGGTTMHWLGTTPRMLPNDFQMKTKYGVGVDWPFGYDDLKRYYEMAELEIGVSGNVKEQKGPGVTKSYYGDYDFPMEKIPQSYLDQVFMKEMKKGGDSVVKLDGKKYKIEFVSTPQGRNSIPCPEYQYRDITWDKRRKKLQLVRSTATEKYKQSGAIWSPNVGLRCEGNASCVPICPVQAKYNALKTLRKAVGEYLDIKTQAVASRVLVDKKGKKVTGIEYKTFDTGDDVIYNTRVAKGKIYVLGASAIENAKILLASGIANSSDQVGRNLMDHLVLLTWGLLPKKAYPYRGPGSTTNIPTFRDGAFRSKHAAWISPVDNWGWAWPVFSPGSDLSDALGKDMLGKELKNHLNHVLTRQLLLHFECEQTPDPNNRITIDEAYKDPIGNYRPIVHYNTNEYMNKSFEAAVKVSNQIFEEANIEDHTSYSQELDPDYVEYKGKGYNFWGAGHIVGTHRMGTKPSNSVVNPDQRTWDHDNLYLIGCGNMPTLGTSNPTLTMSALTFKAAEAILKHLDKK